MEQEPRHLAELTRYAEAEIRQALNDGNYPSIFQLLYVTDILSRIYSIMESKNLDPKVDWGCILFECENKPTSHDCCLTWCCQGLGQGSGTGCRCGIYVNYMPTNNNDVYFILLRNEGKGRLCTTLEDTISYSDIEDYLEIVCNFMIENKDAAIPKTNSL